MSPASSLFLFLIQLIFSSGLTTIVTDKKNKKGSKILLSLYTHITSGITWTLRQSYGSVQTVHGRPPYHLLLY
jgi:hypothetical protein